LTGTGCSVANPYNSASRSRHSRNRLEIVAPAFGTQAPPLADLLHGQTLDQHVMHQRRAVRAKFAFGPVQPQHGLALALGDRFAALPAIDIFPGRIDRARSALGFLPSLWNARPA